MKGILSVLVVMVASFTPSDRASAAPGDPPDYAAMFELAFAPGFTVETRGDYAGQIRVETVPFRIVEAGALELPSGQICAADPFVSLTDAEPFTQAIPVGSFPVRLAVADFPSGGLRVAFARVDFATAPVSRWSMAVTATQDVRTLAEDEFFAYPVDSGTGSFFDPVSGQAAAAIFKADEDAWIAWSTEGDANGSKTVGPYFFLLDQALGGSNAIMFGSGWGDGRYGSWFGYDDSGNVVALVTDFDTIDWRTAKVVGGEGSPGLTAQP